jgi:hypothetical protein
MDPACSTDEGEEEYIGFWLESHKERDHQEDQDIGGWTILKWILEK